MEKKRQDALEMAKKTDEKRKKKQKEIKNLNTEQDKYIKYRLGAWCNQASLRAPVMGND